MKGFVMTTIPNVTLLLLMVTHFSYYTLLKPMDEELIATNSVYGVMWAEGENTTARLKACEKKKGRR